MLSNLLVLTTPAIGPPPKVGLLLLLADPDGLDPDGLDGDEFDPLPGLPKADWGEDPVVAESLPLGDVAATDCDDDALADEPKPPLPKLLPDEAPCSGGALTPATGAPANAACTSLRCSTLKSAPVIGSLYRLRRNLILFVLSRSSILDGYRLNFL